MIFGCKIKSMVDGKDAALDPFGFSAFFIHEPWKARLHMINRTQQETARITILELPGMTVFMVPGSGITKAEPQKDTSSRTSKLDSLVGDCDERSFSWLRGW
jgi:hypothetical protein